MKKEEAQNTFDEKRKAVLNKLRRMDWNNKELDEMLKELEGMEEMKDLEKAINNLKKAKG